LCAAKPTPGLKQALQSSVPQSPGAVLDTFGLSPDGQTMYGALWTAGFAGMVAINTATWTIRAAPAFSSRKDWVISSGEGPWLTWEEFYSHTNWSDFTVFAWNSVTGQLRTLGHSLPGSGGMWPSPYWYPAVSGQYAAWAVGDGPGLVDKVILANLATGRQRVVYQGHALAPFFDGSLVVWPQSTRAQGVTTLHAVSVTSGKPAALPPALLGVHATFNIVTSDGRTAYIVPPSYSQLYYSPSPSQPAHVILTLPPNVQFSSVEMGPGWLAWTTSNATYVASTKTGTYVQVTPEFGSAMGTGSSTVAIQDYVPKTSQAQPTVHLLDFASLDWPSC
jgi:hypothetical protein